jgi:hypothetical protein
MYYISSTAIPWVADGPVFLEGLNGANLATFQVRT